MVYSPSKRAFGLISVVLSNGALARFYDSDVAQPHRSRIAGVIKKLLPNELRSSMQYFELAPQAIADGDQIFRAGCVIGP